MSEIQKPMCDEELLTQDKEFVTKKLGLSEAEFDSLMEKKPRAHTEFKTEGTIYKQYPLLKSIKPFVRAIKGN